MVHRLISAGPVVCAAAARPNARGARRRGEVEEKLRMGWERARIARELGMSEDSVRVHTNEILKRVGVKSVGELVDQMQGEAHVSGVSRHVGR